MHGRLLEALRQNYPNPVELPVALELATSFVRKLEDRESLVSYDQALTTIFCISDIVELKRQYPSLGIDAPWPGFIKRHGFYTVITQEFMQELLREMFRRRLAILPAIEICAGRGVLSHHLQKDGINIVAIDNGSDDNTANRSLADNRDTLSHREALEKYKPKLVVGCWIPDEPQIGQDVLEFPSVDYFIDIGEAPPNSTWLTYEYKPDNFRLMYLHNVRAYAIGITDYFWRDGGYLKFNKHTEVRFWERKGAPMSLDHSEKH